jgi:hypothetical protein
MLVTLLTSSNLILLKVVTFLKFLNHFLIDRGFAKDTTGEAFVSLQKSSSKVTDVMLCTVLAVHPVTLPVPSYCQGAIS